MPETEEDKRTESDWSTTKFGWAAWAGAIALLAGVGGWGGWAELEGAVIAPGEVRLASDRQVVQHRFGGTVTQILARNNDLVQRGDTLLRTNNTKARTELDTSKRRLDEERARIARLEAEIEDRTTIAFPADLRARARAGAILKETLANEGRLHEAQRQASMRGRAEFDSRIKQLEHEIEGLEDQKNAGTRQLALLREQMKAERSLAERALTPRTRVLEMEIEEARVTGALAGHVSGIAARRDEITATVHHRERTEAERRAAALGEAQETRARIEDLINRIEAIEDELGHSDVTSPVDGVVHGSKVHTIGQVLSRGETVMEIVPQGAPMIIDTRVQTTVIDNLTHGQSANVRFPAFNSRTTPEVEGTVARISADRSIEDTNGEPYYTVEVQITPEEIGKLNGQDLLPGMPAEVFIRTVRRTPLSYMMKPITDHLARAWREE